MDLQANGLRTGADGRARCAWCGDDPLYMAYHDEEWGRPTRRRALSVREALPRRLPVRPLLAHHPAQARELPARLRRVRRRGLDPIRPGGRDPAPGRCRHRPPSRQDRIGAQQCRPCGRAQGRGRLAARLRPALRPGTPTGAAGLGRPARRRQDARNRPRSARNCAAAAGASSARPRSMPSCRRWAWSTITSPAAGWAKASRAGLAPRPPARQPQEGAGAAGVNPLGSSQQIRATVQ